MLKKEIRKKYKELRSTLSDDQVEEFSIMIANNLLKIPIWDNTNFHLFLSINKLKEINTDFIMHILQGKDKNIIISKSDFKTHEMQHFLLTDGTKLIVNEYGIPEPINGININEQDIEVVFVPLLAFDNDGNRVGYGKGFYDNFLKKCKKNTIKIGLSFYESENEIQDINELDIPLDYCITPLNTYQFNK